MGVKRCDVHPGTRLIEDLHCDSLDAVELVMEIEDELCVTLPDDPPNMAYKAVFTRSPFRLRDLAELVYLQQGTGRARATGWFRRHAAPPIPASQPAIPFMQLGGRLPASGLAGAPLYAPVGRNAEGYPTVRRAADGMICVLVPAAEVVIGSDDGLPDERPARTERVDAFVIDQEPVSAAAYARFLNSVDEVGERTLREWFMLGADDHRRAHEMLRRTPDGAWAPVAGADRLPMVLVSWHGAAAYARWANGRDPLGDDGGTFLPGEAQWEYAARGPAPRAYPWGDGEPTPARARFGVHRAGVAYAGVADLPVAAVNEPLGVSPFGLLHMAGNVWQWCRDWYAPPADGSPGIRAERGGSWVGPSFLCRSSYRRGRAPHARGRCLGFRCAAPGVGG